MLVVNLHSFFEDLQEQQALQEEMAEMEGMGHREPEVIYVAEAPIRKNLRSKSEE
jgi:hypothetical protein